MLYLAVMSPCWALLTAGPSPGLGGHWWPGGVSPPSRAQSALSGKGSRGQYPASCLLSWTPRTVSGLVPRHLSPHLHILKSPLALDDGGMGYLGQWFWTWLHVRRVRSFCKLQRLGFQQVIYIRNSRNERQHQNFEHCLKGSSGDSNHQGGGKTFI